MTDIAFSQSLQGLKSAEQVSPTVLVIIDSAVEAPQFLAKGIVSGAHAVVLSTERDGIEQISELLQIIPTITSLHIVAHGAPGTLNLGNSALSLSSLDRYASQLGNWFISELLLYGCNVAAGDAGAEFIEKLHFLTGASIAASTTKLGNTSLGGNWHLDTVLGTAVGASAFEAATLAAYSGTLGIPTATITSITPDPRIGSVDSIIIQFSEAVQNFDLNGINVYKDGNSLSEAGLNLTTTNNITWTLSGLSSITNTVGGYQIELYTNVTSVSTNENLDRTYYEAWNFAGSDTVDLNNTDGTVRGPATITSGNETGWEFDNGGIDDAEVPNSELDDAYDGIFENYINGTFVEDADDVVNRTISTDGSTTLNYDPVVIDGLNVTLQQYVDNALPVVRSFVTIQNPTNAAVTFDYYTLGNLGSDSDTQVVASSSGNTTFELADRWVVTNDLYQDVPGSTQFDPTVATIFYGAGARLTPTSVTGLVPTNDGYRINFDDVTVGAGATVSFLFFSAIDDTDAGAQQIAALFNSRPTQFLDGLTEQQLAQIANWDFAAPTGNIVNVAPDPRSGAVDSISIQFSEAVQNVDVADLNLTRNGIAVDLTGTTLTTTDNITYVLGGLTGLTGSFGGYTLTLGASNITDAGGNNMATGDVDSWLTGNTADGLPGPKFKKSRRGDRLKGGKQKDKLTGGAKDDIVNAGNADDIINAKGGNDQVDGGKGNDTVLGKGGSDILKGGEGNDRLVGNGGNDVLVGGLGNDTLLGGGGKDTFVYETIGDGTDSITGFTIGQDLLKLTNIFANPAFAGASTIEQFANFVQLVQVGADTEVRIDADGNGIGTTTNTLAVLKNLAVASIDASSFVLS